MEKNIKWKWWLAGIAAVLLLTAAGWLIWKYYPMIQALTQPENMEAFKSRLQSFGVLGVLALLAVQILQVISAVIPALPIQIGAGVTYGALGGLLICLSGILIGSIIVFVTVKKYGQPVVDRIFSNEKQEKLAFLHNSDRLNMIVFILYFIPAMPKDVFTYLAALTPLTLGRYLGITLVARIPTILCSTFASNALMDGNYTHAVVVFCISGTLGTIAMLCSKRILGWLKTFHK